jgi:hypothetical protein
MSDTEQAFGLAGEEAKQGYEPLHPKEPAPADDGEDFKAVSGRLKSKWESEGRTATGEQPIVERKYFNSETGEPTAPNKTLTLEDARTDHANLYKAERETAEYQHDVELANAIDAKRIEANLAANPELLAQLEQQAQAEQGQQQAQQQQPQQQPAPDGVDPELAQVLANPRVRAALEAEVGRVESARQQFANVTHEVVQVAAASVLATFPELQGLSAQQLPIALDLIGRQNPQRHAEIAAHLERVAALKSAADHGRAQQAQINAHRFQQFAAAEDARLLEKAPELADKGTSRDVAEKTVAALKDVGFTDDELRAAWHGDSAINMRDHRVQLLLLNAMKYREAKTGAAKPAHKDVPPVQRPGVAGMGTNDDSRTEIATLTRRLEKTGSLKDATALRLAKMRAARG